MGFGQGDQGGWHHPMGKLVLFIPRQKYSTFIFGHAPRKRGWFKKTEQAGRL
jgi:hypothetical protein